MAAEELTPQEQAVLAPYCTNLDKDVFGLVNLPEVVKGTLFSRYSRSSKTLRRVLLDEFINLPEMGFQDIVGKPRFDEDPLIAIEKAEQFYDRVLVGYGDDSVAELAGAHLACENISSLAADYLTDARIGISPLEKSARYVTFDKKVNGEYLFCKEPRIMQSEFAEGYLALMNRLFDTYSQWIERAMEYVRSLTPKAADTSERAYLSATRARACDIMKNLLPASRLTNVGLFGNGRAFEYLLTRLYSTELAETQALAQDMHAELRKLIPSFVKRSGRSDYIAERQHRVNAITSSLPAATNHQQRVALVDYDQDAELKVAAGILYPQGGLSLPGLRAEVERMSDEERERVIKEHVGERKNRRDKVGRAFESADYTFEFLASYGVYRDLHRHRQLTQEAQPLTANLGYDAPEELHDLGLVHELDSLMDEAAELYNRLAAVMPLEAQYAVPRLFRMRWYMKMNLREVYHIVELRSGKQGHPDYRRIAQEMYRQVHAVHPALAEAMMVDMNEYALPRIDSERRIDEKLKKLEQRTPS
jgi:thymidylate synthase ThyX